MAQLLDFPRLHIPPPEDDEAERLFRQARWVSSLFWAVCVLLWLLLGLTDH